MKDPAHAMLISLLSSPNANVWRKRLAESFFDPEARRATVEEVRREVETMLATIERKEREATCEALLAHLVGLASQEARPPAIEVAPILSGPQLRNEILRSYPYPIARAFGRMVDQESATAGFGCMLDTFEALLHYLAAVVASAYFRGGASDADCNRSLLTLLIKDGWSTGDLMSMLRDTLRLAGDCNGQLPYPELRSHLFGPRNRPTASLQILESFVALRNRSWGHGTGRDEAYYASILPTNRQRLEDALARMAWLARGELIRPTAVAENGCVIQADLLMGDHRFKGEDYKLQLRPEDLPEKGGDLRIEQSLLLVEPGRNSYLHLFPLSLFRFQLRSQGMFFLQRPQWQRTQGTRRLRRALYVAYESGVEDHIEAAGEPAALSIERCLTRLEASVTANESPATVLADPDCELVEVRHEQEFHLRTFAGREPLLLEVAEWVGERSGGYLLLLGPPGQGKSALLAEAARREQERGGCLLHMVKSHRNPHRFIPALLSQAARLARTSFGSEAYRGDLDDLRNSLIRALIAVRDCAGRAVLFLDALDELDLSAERIAFLPEVLPDGLRVVLSCRPDIPLVAALRNRLRHLDERSLPALSEEDLPLVFAQYLGHETAERVSRLFDWTALFRRLQGNPLLLRRALDHVGRRLADPDAAPINLDELPATVQALFQDVYDEVSGKQPANAGPEARQRGRLLQFLCVAHEPLGFEALTGLMAADERRLSLEDCRDRVLEMSQYLLDAANRFKPWHEGLTEHVRKNLLGEAGCKQVEEVFCAWLARETSFHPYAVRHKIRHLLSVGRVGEAAAILDDWRYLEAKVEAGLIFDLAEELARTAAALPAGHPSCRSLSLLEEAIRTDLHFLARYPSSLFQCLWNRCWWYDCPEAAASHYAEGTAPPRNTQLWRKLQEWLANRQRHFPERFWLRSLRPPEINLGTAQRAVLRGHRLDVNGAVVTPDGRFVLSASGDRSVRVWDLATGAEVGRLRDAGGMVGCLAVSPDGRVAAFGTDQGLVGLWDIGGSHPPRILSGHFGPVKSVAFSADGLRLATVSLEGRGIIWTASGEETAYLAHHVQDAVAVAYFSDGRLATGSWDKTLVVLKPSGALWRRHVIDTHIQDLAVFPGDRHVVVACEDGTARLLDADSGAEILRLHGSGRRSLNCVCVSPDGSRIVTGGDSSLVHVWDLAGRETACHVGHEDRVKDVAFTPDGQRLVSASWDRTVRVWQVEGGERLRRLRGPDRRINAIAWAPDGNYLVSASADQSLWIWDSEGRCVTSVACPCIARCLIFSPDSHRLLCGTGDRLILVLETDSWTILRRIETGAAVDQLAISPDGKRVASANASGRKRELWDLDTGAQLAGLDQDHGYGDDISFTSDGCRILLRGPAGPVREIREWDPVSGSIRVVIEEIAALTKKWIARKTRMETEVVLAATGEPVACFPVALDHLAASPNGRRWAGASSRHLYVFVLEGNG